MEKPTWLTRLRRIVSHAHEGQMYGDQPYFHHILEVVKETQAILAERNITTEHPDYWKYVGVAFGHDVIEDTIITESVLKHEGIPLDVVDGIIAITKTKNERRSEYIHKVMFNKYSHLVKQADSTRNLTWSIRAGVARRIKKYTEYLSFLSEEVMFVVIGSPNQSRLRLVTSSADGTHLKNKDGDILFFDNSNLKLVGCTDK